MTKKGITIIELLISITMVSVVILLLLKVMISLDKINNNNTYASSDEIERAELIKELETDFIKLKLKGVEIKKGDKTEIIFKYEEKNKTLEIEKNKITYDHLSKSLKSVNASFDLCPNYSLVNIDEFYDLIKITIPVLINNKNTTINDDINLTYITLKKETNHFPENYQCN